MIPAHKVQQKVDRKRLFLFLGLAYGIAWLTALGIYLGGGLSNPRQIVPEIPLVIFLLSVPYMWAPAVAHILTRLITREGWKDLGLRPHFRRGWPYWLLGWIVPGLMSIGGAVVFFLLFPQYFDPNLEYIRQHLLTSPALATISPWTVLALEAAGGILISPLANGWATLGEEFGWRAYLLPKLMPLGWRRAVIVMGLIWGVWHWPVILMGYEYGITYPGYPWVGPLLFLWVITALGIFLAWLVLRSGSIWPSVIGHGAMNGIAALAVLATKGSPNPLLGPLPVGLIGSSVGAIIALILFFSPLRKVELPAVKNLLEQQRGQVGTESSSMTLPGPN
jgi:membrane protease YdiL (CAAX protease family)